MTARSWFAVARIVFSVSVAVAFFGGYWLGKSRSHDCVQVGSVVRTDSHVYRVCR